MLLTYAKMLATVVHENMKLGHNSLNNGRLTCKRKMSDKILAGGSPYFTALQYTPNCNNVVIEKKKTKSKKAK